MVNLNTAEKFKKGSLYEITTKNTIIKNVFDSSLTKKATNHISQHPPNDDADDDDKKRYSVYGIKLTDSCINGIMDFLKAKTTDPTNCVSELELNQNNLSDSINAKIIFNQHNLRDKQKMFHLRTIDDCSNNTAAAAVGANSSGNNNNNNNNNNNETSSRQDITVGVKFKSDFKKMISIGSINQKLVVMGNNDSFDMTMKKLENQAQQREQSKAKCIKSSTAKKATTTSIVTRRSAVPMVTLNTIPSVSAIGRISIKTPARVLSTTTRNVGKFAQLPPMNIRNISKPSSNDSKLNTSVVRSNHTPQCDEYSMKDHVIFNLILSSSLSIDDLCDKVSKNTKQTISKTTLSHLIKSITTYNDSSKTYSLITKSQKTPAQIEKWQFYSDDERRPINNNDDTKPPSIGVVVTTNHHQQSLLKKDVPTTTRRQESNLKQDVPTTTRRQESNLRKDVPTTTRRQEPILKKDIPTTTRRQESNLRKDVPTTTRRQESNLKQDLPTTTRRQEPILKKDIPTTTRRQESTSNSDQSTTTRSSYHKRTINKIAPNYINGSLVVNSTTEKLCGNGPTAMKQPKLTPNTKISPSKIALEFDDTSSTFIDVFPPIKDTDKYHKYIGLYDKLYPSYFEKKTQFDQLSAKGKSLHELHANNPNDESIKHKLEEEERKLSSDIDFLDLYSDAKFLHCKLSHIRDMINKFDAAAAAQP